MTFVRVFVNELALRESCAATSPPYAPLESLLRTRQRHPSIAKVLYCPGTMSSIEIRSGVTLSSVVRTMPRDVRNQLFAWIGKMGPFIEDDRQSVESDLFFFGDCEVTDGSLGEAARRIVALLRAAVFSVVHGRKSRFGANPLRVTHGFHDEPIADIDVPNYLHERELIAALVDMAPEPGTWRDLLSICRQLYDRLLVGGHCDEVLSRCPYNPSIGRRVQALLSVLQRLMIEMNEDGSLTEAGNLLREQYFVGERALFSDESSSRKTQKKTRDAFAFPDPEGSGTLTCYWHGKISSQAFRIHFEWPVSPRRKKLRVAYIGPHI